MRPYSTFNADQSENVGYNIPGFPAYLREGRLTGTPNDFMISHWHEDLEFIVIRSGEMTYNINGNLVLLSKDCGIFVNSRQLHYGFSENGKACDFLCVLLHPCLLSGSVYFQNNFVTPLLHRCEYLLLHTQTAWQAELLHRLKALFAAKEQRDLPLIAQLQFLAIFESLYRNLPANAADNRGEEENLLALKQMLTQIQTAYSEQLTLAQIAAAGPCCRSKCAAIFRTYLRESPIQYLTKYRLQKAAGLLVSSNQTVTEIAYAVGFNSASYFCEVFHRRYGVSPRDYRKAAQ